MLLLSTEKLWGVAHNQAIDTMKSLNIADLSAQAAMKAAEAAEDNTRAMREIAQRELRAYVGVVGISQGFNENTVRLALQNTGKTPAYNVESENQGYFITDRGSPIDPNFQFPSNLPPNESTTVLYPSGGFTVPMNVGKAVLDQGYKGEKSVYLYGTIFYKDVFGTTHKSNFCYVYVVEKRDDGIVLGIGYAMCKTHNDAD